jgi:hypothetical protein
VVKGGVVGKHQTKINMANNPYNICLDTPEGTKYLFSNRDAMEQEFFSVPPSPQWFVVSFPTWRDATAFIANGRVQDRAIFVGGPV